ncbi:LysR family transcriptional regulator [Microbulbifer elongatus]|uniref:LysR family transcriptional regulator n=1 Tax=Microbulbifer elongatus TaxID=86173 RepID=A0ABT1P188_9GAMM|nr:LysR family transcriptional regulator [Microbulbifer elongatus]MCQ3829851.1 LysR family transcriptional regulator [Microbulbifer elongatus]
MTIVSRTEDLEILLTVIDSGGFSAAARRLDIQVARVSRAVARLESELKTTLLNRTTRRIELTEECRRFVGSVRDGLQLLQTAEENLRAQQAQPSGRLRVDAATPFLLHQLVPLVPEFRAQYPEIQLELIANERIIDLLEHRTDLAIRIGPLESSNLHAKFLGRSPLHLVATPAYLKRAGTPQHTKDLAQHALIGFADAPHLNILPFKQPQPYQPQLLSSSGETVRQLALRDQGIALLSNFMVHEDLSSGRLVSLLDTALQSPNTREPVHAVYYRSGATPPRITAFLKFLEGRLRL